MFTQRFNPNYQKLKQARLWCLRQIPCLLSRDSVSPVFKKKLYSVQLLSISICLGREGMGQSIFLGAPSSTRSIVVGLLVRVRDHLQLYQASSYAGVGSVINGANNVQFLPLGRVGVTIKFFLSSIQVYDLIQLFIKQHFKKCLKLIKLCLGLTQMCFKTYEGLMINTKIKADPKLIVVILYQIFIESLAKFCFHILGINAEN